MSKKKKRASQVHDLPSMADLNVYCDVILLTDAYRSGHLLDYQKLNTSIREGSLGDKFAEKNWPAITRALRGAAEARKSLSSWHDPRVSSLTDRRRASLVLGFLLLTIGAVFILISILAGPVSDIPFPIISLVLGAALVFAGYIYYRIRIAEYLDTIFLTQSDEGRKASKNLKAMTQSLILGLRQVVQARYSNGMYSELANVDMELYNTDYEYVLGRGVVSKVKRLKKVSIDVHPIDN